MKEKGERRRRVIDKAWEQGWRRGKGKEKERKRKGVRDRLLEKEREREKPWEKRKARGKGQGKGRVNEKKDGRERTRGREGKREGGGRPWPNIKFQASAHSEVILVCFRIGIFLLSQQKMKASVLRNSNHTFLLLLLP